jgi:hypothetical protein
MPGRSAKCVFALDVTGIHVLAEKDVDGPDMTKSRAFRP